MDKAEAIKLLQAIDIRFWLNENNENPIKVKMDMCFKESDNAHQVIELDNDLTAEEKERKHNELCKQNPPGTFEAMAIYDYLLEKGIINTTVINKIDIDKILIVEDGSVDEDKLEERGYEIITYRQGSCPPAWLK